MLDSRHRVSLRIVAGLVLLLLAAAGVVAVAVLKPEPELGGAVEVHLEPAIQVCPILRMDPLVACLL